MPHVQCKPVAHHLRFLRGDFISNQRLICRWRIELLKGMLINHSLVGNEKILIKCAAQVFIISLDIDEIPL